MRLRRFTSFAGTSAALFSLSIAAGAMAAGCGGTESGKTQAIVCADDEVAIEGKGCQCAPGFATVEGGGCKPAGLQCPPGSAAGEGECEAPGVPADQCGDGFKADGQGGCVAILPAEKCPRGQMAIPGETACREVAPCGSGPWGDIPVEAGATQYVDASYAGADSDGTLGKPWTKVQLAIDAAAPGDLIAIAAGDYFEPLSITDKPVRLWGKCPAEVLIHKTAQVASENGPLLGIIGPSTKGTEIHDVALSTDTDHGLEIRATGDLLIERTWVIDTSFAGMILKKNDGPITIRGSLIESARSTGITMSGSDVTIDGSVVRDIELDPIKQDAGVAVDASFSTLTVRSSLLEGNRQSSVILRATKALIERSVVRDTLTDKKGLNGFGVMALADLAMGDPGDLTIRSSVIERNKTVGVILFGAKAQIESTTIRDTQPDDHAQFGFGFYASSIVLNDESTVAQSSASLTSSIIDTSHVVGAVLAGATGTIASSIVRNTQASPDGSAGRGVEIETDGAPSMRTSGSIVSSLIEGNQEMGVLVLGADATIDASLIRDTRPNAEGRFGDGVVVIYLPDAAANATITALRVEGSARAGISNFGANVALGATVLTCSAFDMEGEPYSSQPYAFKNLGGNACGCPVATDNCEALTTGIEAPKPLDNPAAPL